MVEFGHFIDQMNLIDFPTVGNIFSWSNIVGGVASRLDRLLITERAIEAWNIVVQEIGARDISDHRPVWIKSCNLNLGTKPFKVIKGWLVHDKFMEFVKLEWESSNVVGKKDYMIKGKFKLLREGLKWWNREVYGWLDLITMFQIRKISWRG